MKRIGSLIKLRPEYEERYIILHKHTFPDVLNRIRKSNIRNYSIFLKECMLFSHYEYIGTDYEGDMAKIGEDTVTQEWWKLTDPMQEPLETRRKGEWWASLEVLFVMDKIGHPQQVRRCGCVRDLEGQEKKDIVHYFKSVPSWVVESFKKIHIQNVTVYIKDNRLYMYFEYTYADFESDMARFKTYPDMSQWYHRWAEMEEVFHSD